MKPSQFAKLEQDRKFKRQFMPIKVWAKNWLYLLSPAILLLFSLFSIKYLFEIGSLYSWKSIPYIVTFVLSVILLKIVKRHVTQKELGQVGAYLICQAKTIKREGKSIYLLFSIGENRHDKYFIEKYANQLAVADLPLLTTKSGVYQVEGQDNCYVKVFLEAEIKKANAGWTDKDLVQLLFVSEKEISLIPIGYLKK